MATFALGLILFISPQASDFQRVDSIFSQPENTAVVIAPGEWIRMSVALKLVAVEREWVEASSWYLGEYDYVQYQVDTIRMYRDMLEDAPPVGDAARFPPPDVCQKLCEFNRAYSRMLQDRLPWELDREVLINQCLRETEECYDVWCAIRRASWTDTNVLSRRLALKEIRDRLGRERYESGELPPYVPHWRFEAR